MFPKISRPGVRCTPYGFSVRENGGHDNMPTLRRFAETLGIERRVFATTPIFRVNAGADISVERGIRPIGDAGNMVVLDRIAMDVRNAGRNRLDRGFDVPKTAAAISCFRDVWLWTH
ncbi:hypothetical protein [Methylococcus sp. EFPC2]|uniref:hypothetical protein n=1 Tax=Methylococcus sp. EFPC2 TaxID=2812648 RepID=UPI0019676164|nr:hypothetical protein JWZ97_15180 [Methylococcus sp. EFPC2]